MDRASTAGTVWHWGISPLFSSRGSDYQTHDELIDDKQTDLCLVGQLGRNQITCEVQYRLQTGLGNNTSAGKTRHSGTSAWVSEHIDIQVNQIPDELAKKRTVIGTEILPVLLPRVKPLLGESFKGDTPNHDQKL